MENRILEAIESYSLLGSGCKHITVALSGGADSMALLYAMLSLKERLGITVDAAHLNHMIRGDEAERDMRFVKEQCEALDVKLYCESIDVPSVADKKGISLELAARQVRYEFLERVATGLVATAHTASDNLETVLFNLTRGTGLDGLCGIPPKRGIFIRPILLCTRETVEQYCSDNNIPFVTDSTNLADDYTRNKLRHNVVPVLKEVNPSVEGSVMRMCGLLREESDTLRAEAEHFISQNTADGALLTEGLADIPASVAKRVVKLYIEGKTTDCRLENVHIEAVLKTLKKGGKTDLPTRYVAETGYGRLRVLNRDSAQNNTEYIVNIIYSENKFFQNSKKVNNLLLNNLLDCDKIEGQLLVRTRQPGDSIRLLNRGCTKTLNKLYNEYRIPKEQREQLPVIADSKGVVWIYGIGVAQRCEVNASSRQIAKIEVGFKENRGE